MNHNAMLDEMLTHFTNRLKCVNTELAACPIGTLMVTRRDNKISLFQTTGTRKDRCRISINRDPRLAQILARKKYLEIEAQLLKDCILTLEKTTAKWEEPSTENILQKLPGGYRLLSKEWFFPFASEIDQWESAPYNQSDYLSEKKVHLTSHGLAVRSRIEVMIAEQLYSHQVPFRYEEILIAGEHRLSPDFTIKRRRDGKMFYWEHFGMMQNEAYRKQHKWKLGIYEALNIVPWDNLIVTYDDPQGNVDMRIIESEIINKLL